MHFLRSSSVCVLVHTRIKLYINGITSYRIAYKKYIDISYKLDIPPSPTHSTVYRGKSVVILQMTLLLLAIYIIKLFEMSITFLNAFEKSLLSDKAAFI